MRPAKKGARVSWDTVKRTLRRLGCSFRRARRVVPKPAPHQAQARVRRALSKLHRLEAAGKCDVLYADESGFCLQPCYSPASPTFGRRKGRPWACLPRRIRAA